LLNKDVLFCLKFTFFLLCSGEKTPEREAITTTTTTHLSNRAEDVATTDNTYLADTHELQKLKDLILQRDNEISILFT